MRSSLPFPSPRRSSLSDMWSSSDPKYSLYVHGPYRGAGAGTGASEGRESEISSGTDSGPERETGTGTGAVVGTGTGTEGVI